MTNTETVLTVPYRKWKVTGGKVEWKRNDRILSNAVCLMLALPIFTASHPATIVGVRVLNFCVRDGNRWTHTTINTNSWTEELWPFLYKLSFAGFCYQPHTKFFTLVTHTGFEPMLTAWEAAVLTTWPMGHLVHLQGLEPRTHWLRVSCSTNWAKGAYPRHFLMYPENWIPIIISTWVQHTEPALWSSFRLISISQLHTLLCFHLWPINDIVYVEPYSFSGWAAFNSAIKCSHFSNKEAGVVFKSFAAWFKVASNSA